jgi:hypothetical protein
MKITAALIASRDPVVGQSEAFRRVFGDGPARITDEIALDHAETFHWSFLAEEFLSDDGAAQYYETAENEWETYQKRISFAEKEFYTETKEDVAQFLWRVEMLWRKHISKYVKDSDARYAKYEKDVASLDIAHNKNMKPARVKADRAKRTAYIEYQRALARAFAEIYSKENPE